MVEQCESEFDDVYKEVLRTKSGQASLHRLQPGHTYRFRVRARNVEGEDSAPSASVVVHTLLETPPAPSEVSLSEGVLAVSPRQVSVCWKGRGHAVTTRDKAYVDKLLGACTWTPYPCHYSCQ